MEKIEKNRCWMIMAFVLTGCFAMVWIEAVWQPAYLYKSVAKIMVFLGCMAGYSISSGDQMILDVLRVKNSNALLRSVALGAVVYGVVLAAYFVTQSFIDFATISQNLMTKENVSGRNFIYVALYISVVNSMLEELFFRGFAFLRLRAYSSNVKACLFSALAFSGYHIFIMSSWFIPALFLLLILALAVAGALFNFLDRKGTIYNSWVVHMSANLAINTVGLMMFGLL